MAGNFSTWGEAVVLSLAFIAILTLVVSNFNILYHQNNDIGLNDNSTGQKFITYSDSAQQQIKTGEVSLNAYQGITLKSSWGIMTDFVDIIWSFLTGGWIENLAVKMNVGEGMLLLAFYLRILYIVSLIFILLYALFRVVL